MESVLKQKIKKAVEKFAIKEAGSELQNTAEEKVMKQSTTRTAPARQSAARQPSRPAPMMDEMPGFAVDESIEEESHGVQAASELTTVYKIGKDIKEGQKFQGRFLKLREVLSEKLAGGRAHIIEFETVSGEAAFGVWSVGSLTRTFETANVGDVYTITYLGKAEKASKPGLSAPHLFDIKVQQQG